MDAGLSYSFARIEKRINNDLVIIAVTDTWLNESGHSNIIIIGALTPKCFSFLHHLNLRICVIYISSSIPNSKNGFKKSEFFEEFSDYIAEISNFGDKLIILRDLNFHLV